MTLPTDLPPFLTRSRVLAILEAARTELVDVQLKHDETHRRRRALQRSVTRQGAELEATRRQLTVAEARAAAAEQRYAELVTRVMAPPKAPLPHEPLDPEVASLSRIRDDTVERMAKAFVEQDGMNPADADRLARDLAGAADRMYFGGGQV